MNLPFSTIYGLRIEVVPAGTVIQTEEGSITIDDKTCSMNNSTIWLSERVFAAIKSNQECKHFGWNAEGLMVEQAVIDSWPQMQRKKSEHAYQDKEIVFDAEKWIYERKSAYPMVDCIRGSAQGGWKNFNYHPVCKGIVLHDKDVMTLGPDGTYSVKSKGEPILNADEAKYYITYLEATRYAP